MALEFKILGCQKRKKAKAGFNQMKPKNTKKKRAKFFGNNFAKMSVGGVRKKINPPCNDDVIARNIFFFFLNPTISSAFVETV